MLVESIYIFEIIYQSVVPITRVMVCFISTIFEKRDIQESVIFLLIYGKIFLTPPSNLLFWTAPPSGWLMTASWWPQKKRHHVDDPWPPPGVHQQRHLVDAWGGRNYPPLINYSHWTFQERRANVLLFLHHFRTSF